MINEYVPISSLQKTIDDTFSKQDFCCHYGISLIVCGVPTRQQRLLNGPVPIEAGSLEVFSFPRQVLSTVTASQTRTNQSQAGFPEWCSIPFTFMQRGFELLKQFFKLSFPFYLDFVDQLLIVTQQRMFWDKGINHGLDHEETDTFSSINTTRFVWSKLVVSGLWKE